MITEIEALVGAPISFHPPLVTGVLVYPGGGGGGACAHRHRHRQTNRQTETETETETERGVGFYTKVTMKRQELLLIL